MLPGRIRTKRVGTNQLSTSLITSGASHLAGATILLACGPGTRGPVLLDVGDGAVILVPAEAGSDAPVGVADASCSVCGGLIVLNGHSAGEQHGGLDVGIAYTDECSENQVVTGYRGSLTDPPTSGISSLLALCGELVARGSGAGEVTVQHVDALPERGRRTTAAWEQSCPVNGIVTGFSGRSGLAIDQIKIQCNRLILSPTPQGGYLVSLDPATIDVNPPVGGAGGSPFQGACPVGQVARGSNVRASDAVDAFGLICGAPSFASPDVFQAEGAALAGGAQVATNHADYTGSGFVDGYWNPGASVTFSVSVDADRAYETMLRYANSYMMAAQTLGVFVNGQRVLQTSLPLRATWDVWGLKTEVLSLNAGVNTIAYKYETSDSGNVNLDALLVMK
jgi:hypothetical protein